MAGPADPIRWAGPSRISSTCGILPLDMIEIVSYNHPTNQGGLGGSPVKPPPEGRTVVLLLIALVLVLLAIGGGIAIHPLLFILLVVAAIVALAHTRTGTAI